jgi:hypothetical protein
MSQLFAELETPVKEEPVAAWMTTFTDLVALLLCFFVLMFSMREVEPTGWDKLKGSMDGVFTTVPSAQEGSQVRDAMPDAEIVVRRKGSVLPYLRQVWEQKMAEEAVWSGQAITYQPDAGELWVAWQQGAPAVPVAAMLANWRNRVRLEAGNAEDAALALGYLEVLRRNGVTVAQEVRMMPGVAAGVWLVVEDRQ